MHEFWKRMLFGGALCCPGIAITNASGELINGQFQFSGNVPDLLEWDGSYDNYGSRNYVSTGVNESFDESGGFEMLPFGQIGRGGVPGTFNPYVLDAHVQASGSGTMTALGGAYVRLYERSSHNAYAFISGVRALASFSFTLTEAARFELRVHDFGFSNDYGSGSVLFEEIGGATIYEDFTPGGGPNGLVASGVLQAGDYRVLTHSSLGVGDIELLVFPAPSAAAALLGAGLLAHRRRRR